MENMAVTATPAEVALEPKVQPPQYHSVEFSISGLDFNYQFKFIFIN